MESLAFLLGALNFLRNRCFSGTLVNHINRAAETLLADLPGPKEELCAELLRNSAMCKS